MSYDRGTGFYAGVLAILAGYFSVAHLEFAPTSTSMVVFALLRFGSAIFGEERRFILGTAAGSDDT